MVDRRDVASWLEGPGAVARRDVRAPARGERLGLPPSGPGSVAGVGPRLVAFAIDTVLCALLAWLLARDQVWTTPVFAVEVAVLTWLVGGSAGQVVRRLRVVRVDGRPLGAARSLLRTLLLLLFIPAVVWDRDGRGLHDRAAGSVVVHAGRAGA